MVDEDADDHARERLKGREHGRALRADEAVAELEQQRRRGGHAAVERERAL